MNSKSLQRGISRYQGTKSPSQGSLMWFFLITQVGLFHNPHFVSGGSCYNCTSEDNGCNNQLSPSSTAFIKECDAAAIGCSVYAFEYDFIDGVVFHRDCAYTGDLRVLKHREFDSKGESYHDEDKYEYDFLLRHWNGYRRTARHPTVNKVKHPLQYEKGKLRLLIYDESHKELSNSVALSELRKTWPEPKSLPPAKQKSIQCYSCEATEQGDLSDVEEMNEEKHQNGWWLLPGCGEMKTIECKNAYGCATRYEQMDPQDTSWYSRKTFNKTVIWRGCWYPGDMKCIRRGYDYTARDRSLDLNKSRHGFEEETIECRKAYQRSYEDGKEEVVWAGKKPFSSNQEFWNYQRCTHWSRWFAGVEEQEPKYVRTYPEVTNGFALVHYRFCGPMSKCNRDDNTPEVKKEEKKGEEGKDGEKEGERKECKRAPEGDDFEFGPELESCNCTVFHEKDGSVCSKADGDIKIIAMVLFIGFSGVFWTSEIN